MEYYKNNNIYLKRGDEFYLMVPCSLIGNMIREKEIFYSYDEKTGKIYYINNHEQKEMDEKIFLKNYVRRNKRSVGVYYDSEKIFYSTVWYLIGLFFSMFVKFGIFLCIPITMIYIDALKNSKGEYNNEW